MQKSLAFLQCLNFEVKKSGSREFIKQAHSVVALDTYPIAGTFHCGGETYNFNGFNESCDAFSRLFILGLIVSLTLTAVLVPAAGSLKYSGFFRAHIRNVKHDMFKPENNNQSLIISFDDKAYLRPCTDVGVRDVKKSVIFDVADPQKTETVATT